MNRILLVANAAAFSVSAFAQDFSNPDLQSMVDTERAFVKMAKDQNRRDAFLFYLSEEVITSGPNGPVKGKEQIKNQQVKTDLLFWEVAFCDIASSGDFGYTTGPWEYRKNKTDEKPIAFGQFNSIWRKQPDGNWKNVLDIGVGHGEPTDHWELATSTLESSPATPSKDGHLELIRVEKKFIELLTKNKRQAYTKFFSSESRFCHSGHLPIVTSEGRQKFINEDYPTVTFQPVDGEAASSNDLGYIYGTAEVNQVNEGKTEIKKASYARFWKKENGNWKIVLEVLSY